MHWYDGTIAEAVNLSKQRNAIFVVFIEGDNDLSAEMATTIEDGDVLKRLADPSHFLAIKLKSGSTDYTHFAQIYQFVPVPSLFFIGRNGTPLEVVCAGVQPSNLATRIDRILDQHLKDKTGVPPSTSSTNIKQQTTDLLNAEASKQPASADQSDALDHAKPQTSSEPPKKVQKTEHVEVTKSGAEYDVVCEGDVCTRVLRAGPGQPGPSAPSVVIRETEPKVEESPPLVSILKTSKPEEGPKPPAVDDKIEKAKELMEAKRREKAVKEIELEKQRELERRATGQGVAELKQWKAEQELKQIKEDRKREKMANDLARQRILEQIAQDRAERKARDQPSQPPQVQPEVSLPPPPTAGDGGTRARIQFKLPDGSSHTAHFEAAGTLADVHTYVAENLRLSTSNFSLWTAFPRRELTDPTATLRNLQLTPSAALLVMPRRSANNTVASPSTLASIITFLTNMFTTLILEPSQQIYQWILARFNALPPPAPRPPSEGPRPPTEGPGPDTGALRRRGNVHRLGEEKSDDDNNTWNGNSTQQM